MSEKTNLVLFTGQSGIMARECLGRLNQHLDPKAEIISIEERMAKISKRSFRREILLEKISYQYELWRKAFDEVLSELNDSKFAKIVFLTLHGVYYHQDKREFVSPIDFERLSELRGKVKTLIVFIDDIYDLYRRLMVNGEMYSHVKTLEPLEALYASTFDLISILEWRQVEITVSRLIQRILDIPMYIVATKHPAFMIARLINMPTEHLEVFYLCHPISSVRQDAIQRLPNFTGELNIFSKTIIQDSAKVLFLPGTIDELIIKKEREKYLPECSPRWPLPYDEEFSICPCLPKTLEKINPLNPLNYDISSSTEIETSVSHLMKLLWDYIDVQITSRDLSLVEQSKNGVIAYRPYFPHKLSGGIRRELKHNCELSEKEDSRRSTIVSVTEDRSKARSQHLFTLIETFVENLDPKIKQLLQNESHQWIYDPQWIRIFSDETLLKEKSGDIRNGVENVLPKNYRFQTDFLFYETSLPPGEMGKQEKERRVGFEYILGLLLRNPLEDCVILQEDYREFSSPDEVKIDLLLKEYVKKKRKEGAK